jgi:hypothetical protein
VLWWRHDYDEIIQPTVGGSQVQRSVREPAESLSPPQGGAGARPFRSYVMINTDTAEYVVAPTTSDAHAAFIEKFGATVPGWCTRIGASVFATAYAKFRLHRGSVTILSC